MHSNPQSSYLEGKVTGAEPLDLICMIYGAALQNVRNARTSLETTDLTERTRAVNKTNEAIGLLASSLNTDEGGDVAESLLSMYLYMQQRLLEAHASKSSEMFSEVEGLLTTLQSAWTELARKPLRAA